MIGHKVIDLWAPKTGIIYKRLGEAHWVKWHNCKKEKVLHLEFHDRYQVIKK